MRCIAISKCRPERNCLRSSGDSLGDNKDIQDKPCLNYKTSGVGVIKMLLICKGTCIKDFEFSQ